jgi:deuterolysin
MKLTVLFTLAAATGALAATPRKRAAHRQIETLAVDIASPSAKIDYAVNGLRLTASVTNTGSDSVSVLKYGTVLDSLPTKSFTVTKDGEVVGFQGIKVGNSVTPFTPSFI